MSEKISWKRTDLSKILDLSAVDFNESLVGFKFIKMITYLLSNAWLLLAVLIRFYTTNNVSFFGSSVVDNILATNTQRAILTGSIGSLVFFMFVVGGISRNQLGLKSKLKIPERIKNDEDISTFLLAIKSHQILPKGFDVTIAFAVGLFTFLLYIFLIIVNQEGFTSLIYFSFYYSLLSYAAMQGVFILFNPYNLISITILFFTILLPPYLFGIRIFPENNEVFIIRWLPVLFLVVLPLIQKFVPNKSKASRFKSV